MAVNAFSNPQFGVDTKGSLNSTANNLSGANALSPKSAVQSKTKTPNKIYRYPLKQLDGSTDYLQIRVLKYKAPGYQTINQDNLKFTSGTEVLQNSSLKTPLYYIHLPIPSGIEDTNSVDWGKDSINAIEAYGVQGFQKLLGSSDLGKSFADSMQKLGKDASTLSTAGAQDIVQSFFASKLVNSLGGNVSTGGILSRSTGQVLNPNMELLFQAVNLRNFSFTFDLAPRDPSESQMIKDIIRIFKQSMAPKTEVGGQAIGAGLFISSPDVFQLAFKMGSKDHPFLHRFKPCALTNMGINYTASGPYATYADSTPVHMQMSLQFTELNPIYAEDYNSKEGKLGVGY